MTPQQAAATARVARARQMNREPRPEDVKMIKGVAMPGRHAVTRAPAWREQVKKIAGKYAPADDQRDVAAEHILEAVAEGREPDPFDCAVVLA